MGCGGSSEKGNKSPSNGRSDQMSSYDRKPKISVRIGPQARKLNVQPLVVFIFGGPGSRKGRIVDDLVASYGFHHICMEAIIHNELTKKVANVMQIQTAHDIKDLLENDSSHLSLEWVLEVVEQRIQKDNDADGVYLIDFIPNLKYMLKMDMLLHNSTRIMQAFEQKYPISFALNLAVPADKVLKAKHVYCASPGGSGGMKETGGQGDEADSGRIQLAGDEMDTQCLQRRAALYDQNVKSFLSYFAESERLVTVDVTCGVGDFIWQRVHQLLCELDFQPKRTVNTVLFFSFSDEDRQHIDCNKFLMEHVTLADIVDNPSSSMESLLRALSKFIDNQSENTDSFIVNVTGTTLCQPSLDKMEKKGILFADIGEGYLENYLPGTPKNYVPSKNSFKYRAVSSLENEVCLFPLNTPDNVCISITHIMTEGRHL